MMLIGGGFLLWAVAVVAVLLYVLTPRRPKEIRLDPEKARRL